MRVGGACIRVSLTLVDVCIRTIVVIVKAHLTFDRRHVSTAQAPQVVSECVSEDKTPSSSLACGPVC